MDHCLFSMTLATNIICTALVAYRIWVINRRAISFSEHSLRPIMLLVIESGAIYSATLTTLLILYKVKSWFQYVLLDAVSPIVGLVFSMVIVRIGLGLTSADGRTEDFGQVSTLQTSAFRSTRTLDTHSTRSKPVELRSFSAAAKTLDSGDKPISSDHSYPAASSLKLDV